MHDDSRVWKGKTRPFRLAMADSQFVLLYHGARVDAHAEIGMPTNFPTRMYGTYCSLRGSALSSSTQ